MSNFVRLRFKYSLYWLKDLGFSKYLMTPNVKRFGAFVQNRMFKMEEVFLFLSQTETGGEN